MAKGYGPGPSGPGKGKGKGPGGSTGPSLGGSDGRKPGTKICTKCNGSGRVSSGKGKTYPPPKKPKSPANGGNTRRSSPKMKARSSGR